MNDSAASSTMPFANRTVKSATRVNERLGSSSPVRRRHGLAPLRTAASTNGSPRRTRTRARMGRATYGVETTPMSSAVMSFDDSRGSMGPMRPSCSASVVPIAIPESSTGNDHTTSSTRITAVSTPRGP
jgi:hypothetical protein